MPRAAWRWRRFYPTSGTLASYIALVSRPFLRALRRDRPDFFFVQDYATGRFDMLLLIARALHLHRYYREAFGYAPGDLLNAEWISERTLSLPLSPKLILAASAYPYGKVSRPMTEDMPRNPAGPTEPINS